MSSSTSFQADTPVKGDRRAVIVESHLATRLQVLGELHRLGFAAQLFEAKSITDALRILSTEEVDACIVGPGVSGPVAARFIEEGTKACRNRNCAFIAVLTPDADHGPALVAAGADAILPSSYKKTDFNRIVLAATQKAVLRPAAERHETSGTKRPSRSVLVVDPDPRRQRQLRAILRTLDFRHDCVDCCKDLAGARSQAARRGYDLIILCLSPWETEVLDFVQEWAAAGNAPSRVIAYSPQATREQVVNAALAGAEAFLAYPFSAASVEAALDLLAMPPATCGQRPRRGPVEETCRSTRH